MENEIKAIIWMKYGTNWYPNPLLMNLWNPTSLICCSKILVSIELSNQRKVIKKHSQKTESNINLQIEGGTTSFRIVVYCLTDFNVLIVAALSFRCLSEIQPVKLDSKGVIFSFSLSISILMLFSMLPVTLLLEIPKKFSKLNFNPWNLGPIFF